MALFILDTRNQKDGFVIQALLKRGHTILRSKLPWGDIAVSTDITTVIDIKSSGGGLIELARNRMSKDRDRMKREILECFQNNGEITFLCFEPNMTRIEDIANWKVPCFSRWYKDPAKRGKPRTSVNPETLMKSIRTMCEPNHYMPGKTVGFQFATKENCGEIIENILLGGNNNG